MRHTLLAATPALLLACAGPMRSEPADLVLTNGAVYTVDGVRSWAEAVAIGDGRIRYVGPGGGASALIGDTTRVVDLEGKMLLPGFQDAHVHPVDAGVTYNQCPLFDLPSVDEVVAKVKQCAEKDPEAKWIRGGGWTLDLFAPSGLPDKKLLDTVVSERPVSLSAADGHTLWVNSKALEIAGIDAQTPDPPLGRIDRYPGTSEPSGGLQEDSAMMLVIRHQPALTQQELVAGLRYATRLLNGFGITAVQDAIVKLGSGEAYQGFPAYHALDDAGELTLRVVAAMYWDNEAGVDEQVSRFVEARREHSRGRVRASSIKIWQDGVIETHTAALLEPYTDREDGHRGQLLNAPERLNAAVTHLDAEGFQVHFHAIGDRAIRSCLDAVEAARKANGVRDSRHHVSHVQLLDAADIPRFRALGVVANFQPLWAYADSYITELTLPRVGSERARFLYPMQSFLASGAILAFGSDWYVSSANPLLGIETAMTRRGALGETDSAFLPEQRISLDQAIAAYTIRSAYVNFLDDETGSIEVGKLADLVVLDRNLFAIPADEISKASVVATLLEGKLVHGELP